MCLCVRACTYERQTDRQTDRQRQKDRECVCGGGGGGERNRTTKFIIRHTDKYLLTIIMSAYI